jgi:two-component system response regulator NreC
VNKIRILLADDHAVLQAGLEAMLNAQGDMQVVGTAGDGHAAVRQAALLQPDVILLDINMPGINGLEALEQMRVQAPASRVLILTMHDDAQYLRQAMAGRCGGLCAQAVGGQGTALGDPHGGAKRGVYLHPACTPARWLTPDLPSSAPVASR